MSWVRVPAGSQMNIIKYKILDYFQWGELKLNKGQIILVEEQDNGDSMVSVEHYPDRNQLVNSQAVISMEYLEKIEKINS